MTTNVFVDSWGGFWAACTYADEGAKAFGPLGIARPATLAGTSSVADARDIGLSLILVEDDSGWTWATTPSLLLARLRQAEEESVFSLGEYDRLAESGMDIEAEQDRRRRSLLSDVDLEGLRQLDQLELDTSDHRALLWALGE